MASKLNLVQCDEACVTCIKKYKKKHSLKPGEQFEINCNGIPKEYLSPELLATIPQDNLLSMISMLDPVTWAAQVLDWHCTDPDGEIWKRKTLEGSLGEVTPYIEEKYGELVKQGKSAYNRTEQAVMLRCTAKRKVFRIGRQFGKTETCCVAILHALFTHKDFKVIVITPYQTQIDLIFKRLEKLIKSSNNTQNSVKRYVKAPNYTLELHNGSVVMGFTAGTKSGGNADSVRGQKANMLVFDEADYLNSSDMASALAVITNYPDATVWMSSTPSGKKERFYDSCFSSLYKEFHFPSYVNPLWSKDLEDFYHGELTDIEYSHEILAEFGEQAQGVYQNSYVDAALDDYRYNESTRVDTWSYCIGVDWNDTKVGTTIAVIGYNPTTNIFKLVFRTVVSREGWTQLAACEKIIELNRHWKPNWIYVDKGFGGTQHEILTKYGHDSAADTNKGRGHPDSKLSKIVKAYDFSSKVVIKDLFTKQDREKHSKPFLIENSVRRFEQNQMKISKYDKQLEDELRGYIVDHVTNTGLPVYKQGNERIGDHNLDAMNLALVAFTLEMSPYGHVRHESHIGFGPQLGLPKDRPETVSNKLIPGLPKEHKSITPDRTSVIENKKADEPGAHLNTPQRRIWSWPGFESDAPRPVKSRGVLSPAGKFRRPTRKNI